MCTQKWGEKENCMKTEAAYDMRRLATKSHRAQSTPLGLKCGPSVELLLLQRSRVARPATGSNSPLNALEPSFVPKNKKFKFQILWIAIATLAGQHRFRLCVQLFHLPSRLTSKLSQAGSQAVNRSIGMRQIDSWSQLTYWPDSTHWSRLREIHIYASTGLNQIYDSSTGPHVPHLSHLRFLFSAPSPSFFVFVDFIVSQVFWRNWTLWVCCVWAQNSNCCWFVSLGYRTKLCSQVRALLKFPASFATGHAADWLLSWYSCICCYCYSCKCGISLVWFIYY